MTMQPGKFIEGEDVKPYTHPMQYIERASGSKVALLISADKPYAWAIVARHVGGWRCLAKGEMPDAADVGAVGTAVTERFGDGHDYLPRDRFALAGPDKLDVHTLRMAGEPYTFCTKTAPSPYVHIQGRYYQLCTECTTNYLAENFGRHPFEEH